LEHEAHRTDNSARSARDRGTRQQRRRPSLSRREWTEQGKGYREFLVPAIKLNNFPRRRLPGKEWRSCLGQADAGGTADGLERPRRTPSQRQSLAAAGVIAPRRK